MRIKIYTDSSKQTLETTIIADEAFAQAHYPDRWEVEPEPEITPADNPQDWWVYVGPFKDRLGMDAPAIAASTHDACKGVMAMLSDRKYVDLKGDKAAMMLDILIATNQPTANPIFPGSGPMTAEKKAAILGTKPTDEERYKGAA